MFNIDLINIILAIIGTLTISFGFIVFLTETVDRRNKSFFYFIAAVFSWDLTMFMYRGVSSESISAVWAQLLYFSASSIAVTFVILSFIFIDKRYVFTTRKKLVLLVPYALIAVAALTPNLLIKGVIFIPGQENTIIFNYYLHILYAVHFSFFATWAFINFFRKRRRVRDLERKQLTYIIIGTLVTAIVGSTTNLSMPILGNFSYNWMGQVAIFALVITIFYSVLRHGLFNAKIVSTEIFIFILWALLVIRALLSTSTQEFVIDIILIISAVLLGVFLIRSVIKEVNTREQLEVANKKLERLNLEKSEFLSVATHQLKAPLTVIKGYSSMLNEGSYGTITDKGREVVSRIFESAQNLVVVIDDFLNISRIDQGRMKYDFGPVDIKKLISEIVMDFTQIADKNGTKISFTAPKGNEFTITADYGKIRQVVTNILDNSIKYTGRGEVTVTLDKDIATKHMIVGIHDTGIGMSKETIAKLFKRFSRASDIGKQAQTRSGSGLGLYIAQEMVIAHGGTLWAESKGEGAGSVFYIKLPFAPPSSSDKNDFRNDANKKIKARNI